MRRSAVPVVSGLVLTAVLAGLVPTASARAGDADRTSAATHASQAGRSRTLRVERSRKEVAPGSQGQRITAFTPGRSGGRVTFVLTSKDLRLVHRIRVDDGRATYRPRVLGTGRYRVTAHYRGRAGRTQFFVYDSRVILDRTTFTLPRHRHPGDLDELTGRVVYHGHRVTHGYVDVYRDGDRSGGESSPAFLGFGGIKANGTFDYAAFGYDVRRRYPRGVYTFQAFYTPDPSYADYVSSNVITIKVR